MMRGIVSVLGMTVLLAAASAVAEEPAPAPAPAPAAQNGVQKAATDVGMKGASSGGAAKYGPAGCGLGSLIFSPDSGFTQIFAATTNGTSANQTFGITSGTSNCDTGPGSKESAKVFVQTNRTALAKDISRGGGENISALSELAGCSDEAAVGKRLQQSFKTIFSNAKVSDQQVSESVIQTLKSDQSLACTNLT